MQLRLIITYLLNLSDLLFTRHWVNKFGLSIESNPFGRWLLESDLRQAIFKVILPVVALIALWIFQNRKIAKIGSWIILVAYVLLNICYIYLLVRVSTI